MFKRLKIQTSAEGDLEVFDEGGKVLATFVVKENLPKALDLLKQINSLKLKDGTPIYATRMFKGKSTWAFHQHVLLLNYLRQYVMYEPIVEFLHKRDFSEVIISGNLGRLEKILKLSGVRLAKSKEVVGAFRGKILLKALLAKIFSGLITLAAFLKLFFSRTRLLVYTPDKYSKHDCDFRFAAVYDYLRKNKIDFVEVFHTLLNKEFYDNFFKRKRFAVYLEALTSPLFWDNNFKVADVDFSSVESHNVPYFKYLLAIIDKRAQVSIRLTKVLSWLLKLTGVKKLIAVDDMRFTNELVMAGKLNKIETFAFQHGAFIKYLAGFMNYGIPRDLSLTFDKLFVWNEYWKRALLDFSSQYDEKNIEIGGCLRELPDILYKKKDSKITNISQVNLLIPYEGMVGPTNTMKEIGAFIGQFLNLGIKIFFKVRQDVDVKEQLKNYGLSENDKVEAIKDIDEKILSQIDAVVGSYSTFLNEMLFYDKPVFLMKTSFDMGHRLLDDNLAILLQDDFKPEIIIDGINNFSSFRNLVWPKTIPVEQTLDKILSF